MVHSGCNVTQSSTAMMTILKISWGKIWRTMAADVGVQDAAVAEYLARKDDVSAQLRQHGM